MNITIIDGNSLGYTAHYGTVLTHDGMQTQAVYGFVRMLIEQRHNYPNEMLLVVWDGRAQWRFELCETYKSNRHSDDPKREAIREADKKQTPFIFDICKAMGVRQIRCRTHEADDWQDFATKTSIGMWNFFEQTGFKTPEAFLDGKCLKGDSSDAISGVGGIGEKGAPEFIAQFGSVKNFFQGVDAGVIKPSKKVYQRLSSPDGRRLYERNYAVMQLLNVAPIKREDMVMTDRTCKNRNDFINLCGELGFASFMQDPDGILNLF